MKRGLLILGLITLALACKRETTVSDPTNVPDSIEDLTVPSSFNYETGVQSSTSISVKDFQDNPLSGIRINFYDSDPLEGGERFASGFTNSAGQLSTELKIPAYLKEIFVECNYKGFANTQLVSIDNIAINFGGIPAARKGKKGKTNGVQARIPAGDNLYYIGTFSSTGLPDYLEQVGDQISGSLLDDINAALPSGQSVPNTNASYLVSGNQFNTVIDEPSDVWVTFLAEGAGYKNTLGYFVFDTNNPPTTEADVDSILIVFPNASLSGSGGSLIAGDKVYLGAYPAGKTIGWVLLQNAYSSSNNSVSTSAERFYSIADLNPESNSSQRQHTVQLIDDTRQLLVNTFEDLNRESSSANPNGYSSDNDFEDLIFYVSANPWSGVDPNNIPPLVPGQDTDNDGVNDDADDYPNDNQRALDVDYSGNIGFEDLWPSQGDYDFNDLVMQYDITHVLNAQNEVVDVNADWTIRAVGAGFDNGFGWEFENLASSDVASATGSSLQEGIVNVSGNGTESGQTNATVIAFDNVFNEIQHVGGAFINTVKADPQANPVTKSMTVNFSTPQDVNDVGLPPYNPFIFVDGDRGREVHLSDKEPTDLANTSLFGTQDDDSDISQSRYYKTSNNLPWAIHIYGDYDYPVEFSPIDDAHLNFSQWAQSGGGSLENWYLELPGYRDASKIY